MRQFLSLLVLLGLVVDVRAEIAIEGQWIQGAMLSGKTTPGHKVEVLGHTPFVDDAGHFVFGLGRDTAKTIELVEIDMQGKSITHRFIVEQREYETQRIEGVEKKYVAPPESVLQRIRNEASQVRKARATKRPESEFSGGFDWPLYGRITGVYGSQRVFNGVPKRPHFGLDIAGPVGKRVRAPASGVVTLSHDDMYYSGGTLVVDHGQGVSSTFIHLSKILVKEGDYVSQGQDIAEVGARGRVTGPHLDWRVNWFSQRLDPRMLLTEPQPSEASSLQPLKPQPPKGLTVKSN